MKINYECLEQLLKAPSKKYIKKIIEYCFLNRNKLEQFETFQQSSFSQQFFADLQITEQEGHELVINLSHFIQHYLKHEIKDTFPADFHPQLKELLEDILQNYKHIYQNQDLNGIQESDKLVDFDWRLDIQTSSQQNEQMNHPIVFFQIDTKNINTEDRKQTNFQMNVKEVNNFHENLKKIKDQLGELMQD